MSRRVAVLALTLFASLLSCGREITGPGGRGPLAQLAFVPNYSSMIDEVDGVAHSVAALVPFNRVRIELRRLDNSIAASEVVAFPENATEVPLSITVRLSDGANREGEVLTAFLRYINAAGDTVFAGGPISVTAVPGTAGSSQQPVEIPIAPTVPGALFARVEIAPDTVRAAMGQNANFTATGYDAQDAVVPNAIIGFISRNPALVTVPNLGSGTVTLGNLRGSTWLIAQSLTGLQDSAFIEVLPVPSAIDKLVGDGQSGLTSAAFAQPLRVRVRAPDNLPVSNWPVSFTVTAGGGSLSTTLDSTDANGEAEVLWTAGPDAGPASVTASVTAPAIAVVFTGTQATTLPTSLAFQTQPTNIAAGDTLPTINVAVRNGLNEPISDFTGAVTLSFSGGAPTASLLGNTTVNAVAGVASFTGISVNRGGTNYRLLASFDQLPPAQSNTFNVAAAPPSAIALLGGAGQSAPPSTLLADSIRVRLVDAFGFPIAGQTLQFAVAQGGGTLSGTSVVTDADGRAAVTWTIGAAGTQQLRVSLGALETFVTASIVASGSVQLVAGYDYTVARVGMAKAIPIFLTNPSPTPIEVTLQIDEVGGPFLAWQTPTITINPGITRVDANLNGLGVGGGWAIMRSSVGDDSVLVTVDSSFLELSSLNNYDFLEGDTVRAFVGLSEPAPAGGLTVVVRSQNGSLAQVAPSSGSGVPAEGCIGGACYNGGGLMSMRSVAEPVPETNSQLLSPPADTAAVFIPEGQVFGEYAILLLDDLGSSAFVEIVAEAPNFAGGYTSFYISRQQVLVYPESNDPAFGIGVGQQANFQVYSAVRRARESRIYFQSTDTTRVQVDSFVVLPPDETYVPGVSMRMVGLDSAWVRYWADGSDVDSLLFVGSAPRLRFSGNSSAPEGGENSISVRVASALNPFSQFPRFSDLLVTVTTGDSGIAQPVQQSVRLRAGDASAEVSVRGITFASTFLALSAPGHLPDTTFFGSSRPSPSLNNYNPQIGEQQLYDASFSLPFEAVSASARTVSVQSLSPGIVEIVTPTVEVSRTSPTTEARLRGVSAGVATVRFSGPGLTTQDITVTVSPTTLQLFAAGTVVPDGALRSVTAAIGLSGFVRPLADTARAVIRSSDPNVLEVVDSVVVFPALASAYVYTGLVRPVAPGAATLWLVRENIDSVSAPVTVTPFQIRTQFSTVVVGEQMQGDFTLYREGPDTLALPISVTQSGPGRVSFPGAPAQFDIGNYAESFTWVGDSVGVDTLTFTVPGYAPTSAVVFVENSTVRIELAVGAHAGHEFPWASTAFSATGASPSLTPGRALRFRLISLDTARVQVVQDTVEWAAGIAYAPSRYATLRFKTPGNVLLTVEDLDGVMDSDTTQILVEPGDLYGNSYYGGGQTLALGMGQRTEQSELFIQRGMVSTEPLWVHLESSNPSIVQVPDSIEIAALNLFAHFVVAAGDSTGSARITASAFGYNPWLLDVLVTRAKFSLYTAETFTDGGGEFEVYAVDALTGIARPFTADVDARFTTSTPALLDAVGTAPFTIPAGQSYMFERGPLGLAPGEAIVGVADNGPVRFDSIASTAERTSVLAPSVASNLRRIQLTPGLLSQSYDLQAIIQSGRDSVTTRYTALGTRFAPAEDSIGTQMWSTYLGQAFLLSGLSLGRDTLTISMDAAATDSVIVDVEPGLLAPFAEIGQSVVVGDSVFISLSVLDAAGNAATATSDIVFTSFSNDTSFVFLEGGAPVSTVTLTGGQSLIQFWVRAETSGVATLTLSNPNFRTFSFRLNSVVRP